MSETYGSAEFEALVENRTRRSSMKLERGSLSLPIVRGITQRLLGLPSARSLISPKFTRLYMAATCKQAPPLGFKIEFRVGHRFTKRVIALSDCFITLGAAYLLSKGRKESSFVLKFLVLSKCEIGQ